MNSQIETWRVQQFSGNVFHLAQQKMSRLYPLCRQEKIVGKTAHFDRLGLATAQTKTGRNVDTPNLNIDHSRRTVSTVIKEWATLVDTKDKLQNVHEPENEYAVSARQAIGRSIDSVIIAAALGNAYGGEDGTSTTALGTANKVVAVSGGAKANLNVLALRKAKQLMDEAEVDPSLKRYMVVNASAMDALLALTEVTSSDYNTVKALVQGEINSYMGFEFIRTELLSDDLASSQTHKFNTTTGLYDAGGTLVSTFTTAASCFAFAAGGLLAASAKDYTAKIEQRADKSYDWQVYTSQDIGAVRMEESRVVEVICEQG